MRVQRLLLIWICITAAVVLEAQTNFPLSEGRRIEFRWEVFNVLNKAHFDVPGRIAFTPTFGRVFNTAEPARQMQFRLQADLLTSNDER
jgi:hypothetical protein